MFRYHSQVNIAMLSRVLGWLLMIEAVFMAIPLGVSLLYGDNDYKAFALSAGVTFIAGLLATTFIRPRRTDMGKREGFLLTALVWVVFSAFGMLPFMIGDNHLNLSDAYFEAMSGFTTTGASVLKDIENQSHGVLLWRALMQWIGGMGIILFTLAVMPMLNSSGGMQMFNAEVTGITHEKLRPRVSQTAKRLWALYFLLTLLLIGALWIGPMNIFESICHALSTISTGGFSTRQGSIADFNSIYVEVVLTVFMFLGGVNFALLIKEVSGQRGALWRNEVFRAYVLMILIITVLMSLNIAWRGAYGGVATVTIDPLFQVVSTITSTGYTEADFESWGAFAISLVILLMFFGACAGSTSGGAKIDRLLMLHKTLRIEIYRVLHPNSVMSVRVNDKVMSQEVVDRVLAFLCLYMILIVAGGSILTAFDIPLVDSFFSAFSAMSNTGLGAGITGLGSSFDVIPSVGKWVLALLMLIGRLEIFTVLILFTPGFWKK